MMNWAGKFRDAADNNAISVNVSNAKELLADIENRLASNQGFSVATLNLDHVVKIQNEPEFRDAYMRHSHVTADGNPIVWLLRLAGKKLKLVPGSELVEPVIEISARVGANVALLGSTQESLDTASQKLLASYPELKIVAAISPPMGFDPNGTLANTYIQQLEDTQAQVCFLALGAPKQEIFAARASEILPSTGFLSIGAGIDFISGLQTRAPKFFRAIGAEWLWRLGANPGRLAHRYWSCIVILPGLVGTAIRYRAQFKSRV